MSTIFTKPRSLNEVMLAAGPGSGRANAAPGLGKSRLMKKLFQPRDKRGRYRKPTNVEWHQSFVASLEPADLVGFLSADAQALVPEKQEELPQWSYPNE